MTTLEPDFDPIPPDPTECSLSECRNWNRTWNLFPSEMQPRDKCYFRVFHRVTRKIVEQLSLRHLAVFIAVAVHANADGVCEPAPSSGTIGELVGMRDERTISKYVRDLEGGGWLQRQRIGWKRWRITVARTDGPRDYVQVDRRWFARGGMSANAIGLAFVIMALANGRPSFVTERKVLEKMSGLSRNALASVLSEIQNQSLVETSRAPRNMLALNVEFMDWTLPKKSRPSQKFAQKVAVLPRDFAQKTAGEEDKPKTLEEHKGFKGLEENKSKTGSEQDQRVRADANSPNFFLSQVHDQNPPAIVETPAKIGSVSSAWLHAGFCESGWIKLYGVLRLCPHCAASVPSEKHGCERGWRTSKDGVWHCPYCRARDHGCVGSEYSRTEDRVVLSLDANGRLVRKPCQKCADEREAETKRREMEQKNAEPPTHENCTCEHGFVYMVDAKGHTQAKPCERLIAYEKWDKAERARLEAEEKSARDAEYMARNMHLFNMFERPSAPRPHLPAADVFNDQPPHTHTIEGQWTESKPAPTPERDVGDIMPTAMYQELWKRIETESGVVKDDWDKRTRSRVDGMLRKGGVAAFGPDRFHQALRDAIGEEWQRRHAHCHEPDHCDEYPEYIDDEKRLLDLIGHAIQCLRQDERFGRDFNTYCPNAMQARIFGWTAEAYVASSPAPPHKGKKRAKPENLDKIDYYAGLRQTEDGRWVRA